MKRILLSLLAVALSTGMYAQYRDVKLPEKPNKPGYRDYTKQETGFWFAIEAEGGTSIMENKKNMQYANLTFTGGYRINEFLRVGAGFGGRAYINNAEIRNTDRKFCLPLFANARGNIISAYDRDGVPFWSLNVGGITDDGFFLSPTLGYSFGGLRNNFQIGISYTLSSFKNCSNKNMSYSYFGLKLGYEF